MRNTDLPSIDCPRGDISVTKARAVSSFDFSCFGASCSLCAMPSGLWGSVETGMLQYITIIKELQPQSSCVDVSLLIHPPDLGR
jgi:hypothetical protein